ncbi:hypothetical protein [Chryseobacterium sp.]|uniref:hypothetical protein n=1 Tax=Chryseobacterium sp. TaxID=1871047 RepID=UPI002FCC9D20
MRNVSYIQNTKGELSVNASTISKIINDKSITVALKAENTISTSTGDNYIGGAFMGNKVVLAGTIEAVQEITPQVLANFSDANGKPGMGVLHEVSEGYEGALISKASGISSPGSTNPSSVYPQAHKAAHPQPGVVNELFEESSMGLILPRTYLSPTAPVNAVTYNSNNRTILIRRKDGTHTP